MNKTMNLLVCILLVLGSNSVAAGKLSPTPDGRFGSPCHRWGKDPRKELCDVSFYHLFSKPETYHGRLIAVHGYLIKLYGSYVLFPSRESFDSGAEIEGIELQGDVELTEGLRSNAEGGVFPVIVVGVYDAKYSGFKLPRLGALRDVSHVLPASRMTD